MFFRRNRRPPPIFPKPWHFPITDRLAAIREFAPTFAAGAFMVVAGSLACLWARLRGTD